MAWRQLWWVEVRLREQIGGDASYSRFATADAVAAWLVTR